MRGSHLCQSGNAIYGRFAPFTFRPLLGLPGIVQVAKRSVRGRNYEGPKRQITGNMLLQK